MPAGTQDVYCFVALTNVALNDVAVAIIKVSGVDGSIQTFNFSSELQDAVIYDGINYVTVDSSGNVYAIYSLEQNSPYSGGAGPLSTYLVKYNAQGQQVNFTIDNSTLDSNTAYGLQMAYDPYDSLVVDNQGFLYFNGFFSNSLTKVNATSGEVVAEVDTSMFNNGNGPALAIDLTHSVLYINFESNRWSRPPVYPILRRFLTLRLCHLEHGNSDQ